MTRIRWMLIALALCGFTATDSLTTTVETTRTQLAQKQDNTLKAKGKYDQQLPRPSVLTNAQPQTEVHEYVGPEGVGYTLFVRTRQVSCPENPDGTPCVWEWFQHEGPETYRDLGEGHWTLRP